MTWRRIALEICDRFYLWILAVVLLVAGMKNPRRTLRLFSKEFIGIASLEEELAYWEESKDRRR